MTIAWGRRIGAVVVSVLLLAATACGDGGPRTMLTGTVNIGGKSDQPGFNLHSRHSDSGFEVDLIHYLGEELNFTPQITDVTSSHREESLKNGKNKLVIATYSITDDRKEDMDFVGPYLSTSQGMLVREESKIHGLADITAEKSICTGEGSTSASAHLLPGNLQPYEQPDFSTCVSDLLNKQADAVFTDKVILYGYAQVHKSLRVVRDLSFGSANRYGIGLAKGHMNDCKALVRALRNFLNEKWSAYFKNQFESIVEAFPDWENRFKPSVDELNQYSSCPV
ncbi:transporter substrate-binding domain-containing protein [Streptomyces sp. B1866]|uniref:transporter substrate-binding domain-containing protein n=1 Tax=Streptomyces sp. B1866 TaxID=3075431 RepID=UPI0028900C4F|nr:transporter substrate-binding domain-containing protein [Streptomyces sp. B1866]MDT3395542.1 transporter substrate-binding domain-containing protein [Streptomyces sp. B1866]